MIFRIDDKHFTKLITQLGSRVHYCEITLNESKAPVVGIKFDIPGKAQSTFRTLVVIQE